MISRVLLAALCVGAVAFPIAAGGQQRQTAAPPPIIFAPPPPPRPDPLPGPRPLASGLRVIGGPDWADPAIYPAAALRLDQEGPVRFELLVGPNGRPQTCTIVESSGHGELDAGTCRLAMTLRFAPPREEIRTRLRVVWLLAPDPMPFVPQRMVATFQLANGAVTDCRLDGNGPLFESWSRIACRTFALEADYYLRAHRFGASRATVVVDMVPDGSTAPPLPGGRGTVTAVRRTAFAVDASGDPSDCRTIEDRGFGRPRIDHADACGFFMAEGFEFTAVEEADAEPRRGTVTVRVMIELPPTLRPVR